MDLFSSCIIWILYNFMYIYAMHAKVQKYIGMLLSSVMCTSKLQPFLLSMMTPDIS
jgi:hypothetical protein